MFAAPPPTSAEPAVLLLRHCLRLLAADMALLRQVGGAGLWLLLAGAMHRDACSSNSSGGGSGQQRCAAPLLEALRQVWCVCV
jgi:hypothetical protein